MSPKYSSLAVDESFKEFDNETALEDSFEPHLEVIVNAHFGKIPSPSATSSDVLNVTGRITVSF